MAAMSDFEAYATRYEHLRMERRDGILQVTLHSAGETLRWGGGPHHELGAAFRDIGADRDNRVVILTGTGESFIELVDESNVGQRLPATQMSARVWDRITWDAKQLLTNLLDICVAGKRWPTLLSSTSSMNDSPVPVRMTTRLSRSAPISRNAAPNS